MDSTTGIDTQAAAWLRAARAQGTSRAEATAAFDDLDTVAAETMTGRWKGSGVQTDHPFDGMLEAFGWYGKAFIDAETVFPLLFGEDGGKTIAIDPRFLPVGLATRLRLQRSAIASRLFGVGKSLIATGRPTARLRMTEYRGRISATMIYDALPINDVFRRIDDDTLLGAMDYRGFDAPFFFVLERR